ncbi:aminoglycoside phosphotransferase family protein [Streptomyces sp. SAS_276]|uniref:aminoglycoside phosphotransferase family protein n=1 Tax=Streptomyces sp. SAS_276 TaxID=3412745 RepID=UPI00403D4F9F
MAESALGGGAVNEVVRVGETVRRTPVPLERSGYVTGLLAYFARRGWPGAPRFLGTDERGREMFRYVEGRAAVRTDDSLVRVARLVRAFHDLTHGIPQSGEQDVVCHSDLAPRNTVYDSAWHPMAFVDWDLAAPGERIHDVAHVCWQYLDLGPDIVDLPATARRIALICEAYGLDDTHRLLDTVLWWQDRCRRGIEAGAERGERGMVALRARGVVDGIGDSRAWVAAHRRELGASLR